MGSDRRQAGVGCSREGKAGDEDSDGKSSRITYQSRDIGFLSLFPHLLNGVTNACPAYLPRMGSPTTQNLIAMGDRSTSEASIHSLSVLFFTEDFVL